MKSLLAFSLVFLSAGSAQELRVGEKGLHHRVLETVRAISTSRGVRFETNQIIELQGGMHRWTDQGWVTTDPKVEVFGENGVVHNLQYGAIFAANLATPGAIDFSLPDGQRLTGHLLGLAYTEANNSVMIAEVKDCVGVVGGAAQNEVTYLDAFTDFNIAVQYVTQRDRISQNIIVQQQLPSPLEFGLTENAVLEILTEFTAFPEVRKEPREPIGGVNNEHLSFASMEFLTGRAFSLGQENNAVTVSKTWEAFENNRWFLVEKVPWRSIAAELANLPPVAKDWRKKDKGVIARKDMHLPDRRQARAAIKPIRMASATPKRGYLIDWELVSSVNSNLWRGDTTYYVSGSFSIKTNIFEPGCVLKYAPTNSAKLTITGPATFLSKPYGSVVMTHRDDHTIGEQIGSTTLSGYAAMKAVEFDSNASGVTYDIHDLRISHATTGLSFFSGRIQTVRNLQIVHCQNGISGYSASFNIFNGLLHQVDVAFTGSGTSTTGNVQHLTFNQCSNLNSGTLTLLATNSLLVAVTNITSFAGAYNGTNSDPSTAFQAVGGGSSYLASDSSFRNAGTTNIDLTLLAALKQKTTYPPQVLSNAITLNTTLRPYAQRDTDVPDLGYHPEPIDYALGWCVVTNATLTLTNGVAIATFGDPGIAVYNDAQIVGFGKPERRVQICRYNVVQEQSTNWGNASVGNHNQIYSYQWAATAPTGRFRFTDFSSYAGGGYHVYTSDSGFVFSSLVIRDCEFSTGRLILAGSDGARLGITNNLFHRVDVDFTFGPEINAYNNLFRGANCYFEKYSSSNSWTWKDNSFDDATISQPSSETITHNYNAYINCNTRLTPNGANDVVTNSFTYHVGPFGPWYQPTNSALVDKGSLTNAALAGLYQTTTATNGVKEANTIINIGLHYVAADYATGVALDYDGDTWAEWFEDINGNGSYDAGIGESDWQAYNSIYGIGSGPGLQVFTPLR